MLTSRMGGTCVSSLNCIRIITQIASSNGHDIYFGQYEWKYSPSKCLMPCCQATFTIRRISCCLYDKGIIIAVSAGYLQSGTLFYRLGKVDGILRSKVEWQDENKIELDGHCAFPSVAATSEEVILLAYVKTKLHATISLEI